MVGSRDATLDTIVFDASAIIAWWDAEPGGEVVLQMVEDNPGRLFIHGMNACEVAYHHRRRVGRHGIQEAAERLAAAGVVVLEDLDATYRDDVALLKVDYGPMSLADCCCLALARRLDALAVTTDHGEMDALVPLNICRLRFIR